MKYGKMIFTAVLLAFSSSVFAADAPSASTKAMKGPTKEQRQKMAEMHEKMATCLKSDRTIDECRTEMMKGCDEAFGKDGCPMMGKGMHKRHWRNRSSD